MRMLALVLAFISLPLGAQTTALQQLQGTSPQFSTFAGSDANLQSLVNGLGAGQAVTLVTQNADGTLQIVTFIPPSGLGSGVSRVLEQARSNLIARGIAQPTGQQIAVALMGGTLATSAGAVQIPGVLTNTIPANAVQVRNESPSTFTTGTVPFGPQNFQALSTGLQQGTPIRLTSTVNGVQQTVAITPPSGPMSAIDANQLLQVANQTLLSLGIINPTPSQIQIALLGGNLPVQGGNVALQGVLQNRTLTTTTSTSTLFGTSNSPVVGTSATPAVGTSNSPFVGANGSPIFGSGGSTPAITSPTVGTPIFGSGAGASAGTGATSPTTTPGAAGTTATPGGLNPGIGRR
jgi:hypothetical protein